MSSFGHRLKEERKRKNFSQIELSRKSGVSQQTISAIESGRNSPSEQTILMLAAALSCPIGELLGEKKNSPSSEGEELRETVVSLLSDLPAEDVQRVQDFVAGLKAARKGRATRPKSDRQ